MKNKIGTLAGARAKQGAGTNGHLPAPGWKRVMDTLCVICVFPLILPLMLLIMLFIKCVSPGPVFFRQLRVGHQGRRFMCFKFRTMLVSADTSGHQSYLNHLIVSNVPMIKMDAKGDSRLIPFARLLRATGLDELPQIFNVLKGEMSLVGPRPCLPYEHDTYRPRHRRRCDTLPGLTGLWQVNGKNKTTFRRMIAMDLWYVANKSIWVDAWIIARTIPAIVGLVVESRKSELAKKKLAPRANNPPSLVNSKSPSV